MIDLHCHLLPGIDDGPETIEESLEMARIFVKTGYKKVVATPHWIFGTSWMPSPKTISRRVAELNHRMQDEGVNLTAFLGMEIALDHKIPELLNTHEITGLAGKSYILIEPPFLRLPLGWEDIFFQILSMGYKILLAHPERCAQLTEQNGIIDEFIRAGLYLQVNWFSFLGYYGPEAEETARYLAANGYIHCLATDSHDTRNRHAGHVREAAGAVKKLIGLDNLRIAAKDNPERVLQGDSLISISKSELHDKQTGKRRWLRS